MYLGVCLFKKKTHSVVYYSYVYSLADCYIIIFCILRPMSMEDENLLKN